MADLDDLKGGSAARSAPIDLAREPDLRDSDAALGMLGLLLERDTGRVVTAAHTDPDLASLRGDPRFQAMLAAASARLAADNLAVGAGSSESA